jgi:uncharacterized membrane protein
LEAQVEAQVLEARAALALAQVEVKVLALAVESVVARVREQVVAEVQAHEQVLDSEKE